MRQEMGIPGRSGQGHFLHPWVLWCPRHTVPNTLEEPLGFTHSATANASLTGNAPHTHTQKRHCASSQASLSPVKLTRSNDHHRPLPRAAGPSHHSAQAATALRGDGEGWVCKPDTAV